MDETRMAAIRNRVMDDARWTEIFLEKEEGGRLYFIGKNASFGTQIARVSFVNNNTGFNVDYINGKPCDLIKQWYEPEQGTR